MRNTKIAFGLVRGEDERSVAAQFIMVCWDGTWIVEDVALTTRAPWRSANLLASIFALLAIWRCDRTQSRRVLYSEHKSIVNFALRLRTSRASSNFLRMSCFRSPFAEETDQKRVAGLKAGEREIAVARSFLGLWFKGVDPGGRSKQRHRFIEWIGEGKEAGQDLVCFYETTGLSRRAVENELGSGGLKRIEGVRDLTQLVQDLVNEPPRLARAKKDNAETRVLAALGKATDHAAGDDIETADPLEIIYIDSHRVDSYYAQIGRLNRLPAADKARSWRDLSANTTSKDRGSEGMRICDPGLLARADSVAQRIRKSRRFCPSETGQWTEAYLFGEAIVAARRWVVPPAKAKQAGHNYLAVWVCEPDTVRRMGMNLYLVEGSPEADPSGATLFTSYSALEFLTDLLHKETIEFRSRLLCDAELWSPDLPREAAFASDPARFLSEIGAFGAPVRRVRALFRRRVCFTDIYSHPGATIDGVIGYPLLIWDASDAR